MKSYFVKYPKTVGRYVFASQSLQATDEDSIKKVISEIRAFVRSEKYGSTYVTDFFGQSSSKKKLPMIWVNKNTNSYTVKCGWPATRYETFDAECEEFVADVRDILKKNSVDGSASIEVGTGRTFHQSGPTVWIRFAM